ncbi:MAG: hypothetical protein E7198_10220 [Schwartzia succinivorans]|jgi:hypothetical protein|uniref:hypothetical protein n=1 Tax=Schwartzia succinivorans TaxID=55507 RepID=UPI0023545045|nr:hypothetical protein [Schwartzia succinivorans]MBE6098153.1 hypothetical protein [Schwartzia succinivorans]
MKKKLTAYLAGLMLMSSATAFAAIPSTDIALGDVQPGMSINDAVAAFGEPRYRDHGEKATFSNGIKIELDDYSHSTIEEIQLSRNGSAATPAGITIGSSENAVIKAYGQPDKMEYDDGKQEYTYYASDSGMKMEFKILRGSVVKIKCDID